MHGNRIKEALIRLSVLMEGIHNADFTLQFENLDQTYRMLLEYTFRGVPDPQRDKIYHSLKVQLANFHLDRTPIVRQPRAMYILFTQTRQLVIVLDLTQVQLLILN